MNGRVAMLLSNALHSDPRVEKEAAALVAAGLEVTVIAWDRALSGPPEEERGGVRILRVGPEARHGGGLANLGAYRGFWRVAAEEAARLAPDAVHCHDLDTAQAGLRAARGSERRKLVLDMHELYRESNMVPQRGLPGVAARAGVRVVERRALPAADAVLVANPGTLDYYGRFGVGDRLTPIENAPDAEMFRPAEERRPDRPLTVGYFGQKRYVGGLRTLMEVVDAHEDMAALLAGGGTAAEEVAVIAAELRRIEVRGRFAYADLPAYYARCDVVYAVYEAGIGNVRTLFPVKMMEAMACGLPCIVSSGTWAGDYAVREGVGLAVQPGDGAALDAALVRLRDEPGTRAEMGRRGRAIVEAGLNWQEVARRLLLVYEGLLSQQATPAAPPRAGVYW
ncbi:MAG: glycosyltransferase family 4 protein [Coriobacteriia bacterium]|nr:glycosyltransferase family 4 protein [Coriobacteriia bacterium]